MKLVICLYSLTTIAADCLVSWNGLIIRPTESIANGAAFIDSQQQKTAQVGEKT